MRIFWVFLLVILFLFFYPWPCKLRGDFQLEPKGKRWNLLLYGKFQYLFFRKQQLIQRNWSDAQVVDVFFQGEKDYQKTDLFPDLSTRFFLKGLEKYFPLFRVKHWVWETTVGDGNAAHTALYCGVLWGVKGAVMQWLRHWLAFAAPQVRVMPDYVQGGIQTHWECIIQLNFVQIMGVIGFYWLAGHKKKPQNKKNG